MEFPVFAARSGEAQVPSTRQKVTIINDVRAKRVPNMATVWLVASADATSAALNGASLPQDETIDFD